MNDEIAYQIVNSDRNFSREKDYWRNKIDQDTESGMIPYDVMNADTNVTYVERRFVLPQEISEGVIKRSKKSLYSMYTVLSSAIGYVVHSLYSMNHFLIGAPAFVQRGEKKYANDILALKYSIDDQIGIPTYLEDLWNEIYESNEHMKYPVEMLLQTIKKKKHNIDTPVFEIMIEMEGIHCEVTSNRYLYNILFRWILIEDKIECSVIYNTKRYVQGTIERFFDFLLSYLKEINGLTCKSLSDLCLLSEEERNKVLYEFNQTKQGDSLDHTIHELFEQQVKLNEKKSAVLFCSDFFSYGDINEKANEYAYELLEKGIRKSDVVAVLMKRSANLIAAMIGVLKAGGICLPISMDYPKAWILDILQDSKARFVISSEQQSELQGWAGEYIDANEKKKASGEYGNPKGGMDLHDAAFLIYTSGSTGKPKGVLLNHQGILNHLYSKISLLQMSRDDIIAHNMNVNFVASIWQVFAPLITGALVIFYDEDRIKDVYQLLQCMDEDEVSIVTMVPSMLNTYLTLLEQGKEPVRLTKVRRMILTGELLRSELVQRFQKRYGIQLINAYGQTECSDDTLHYIVPNHTKQEIIPIGRPVHNTKIYILDEWKRPLPIGQIGELYISGIGLSKGYFNAEEWTEQQFVPNPFETGTRMYRTYDLARWLPDGNVEYIGRKDRQIKLRGYRIELGEIEKRIMEMDSVDEAAVVDRQDADQEKMIYAFVRGKYARMDEILEHLKNRLPMYMLPARIIRLDTFPMTQTGKIDYVSLKARNVVQSIDITGIPVTVVESKLADIWKTILKVEQVGVNDNYFTLGGNSLKGTTLLYLIQQEFGVDIKLRDLFSKPTIHELAKRITEAIHTRFESIPMAKEREFYPVSYAQRRLFFIHSLKNCKNIYNISGAIRLHGNMEEARVQQTFQALVDRHESFRTSFQVVNGEVVQHIEDHITVAIEQEDLGGEPLKQESKIAQSIKEFIRPFDLKVAPLLRVRLIKITDTDHILAYDMDHMIADGLSLQILMQEFIQLYQGKELKKNTIRYRDYVVWQQAIVSKTLGKQKKYWLELLKEHSLRAELPLDYPREEVQRFEGDRIDITLEKAVVTKIKELSLAASSTVYMFLLACLNILVFKMTANPDVIIGTSMAGRNHPDLSEVIGMFVNTVIQKCRVEDESTFMQLLQQVKDGTLRAYENQDYPFEKLVEDLHLEHSLSRNPLFDIMFILHNAERDMKSQEGFSIQRYDIKNDQSKFDLLLEAFEQEDRIELSIEYNTSLFRRATMERIASWYQTIITSALQDAGRSIRQMNLTSKEEYKLFDFVNQTRTREQLQKNLYELVEKQVGKEPDRIAIKCNRNRLTYAELDDSTRKLSQYIAQQGIGNGDVIAVRMERSIPLVIAMLAIVRSNAVGMIIDQACPQERFHYMIQDSKAVGILSYEREYHLEMIEKNSEQRTREIDAVGAKEASTFIVYTSGSTGEPKGVLLNPKGIMNHITAKIELLGLKKEDHIAHNMNMSFVASIWQVFAPLMVGATLCIYDEKLMLDAYKLLLRMQEDGASVITMVPAMLQSYLLVLKRGASQIELPAVRKLILTGERVSPELVNDFYKRYHIQLVNAYGQSECCDDTLHYVIPYDTNTQMVPIGRPIRNMRIYILDHNKQTQPVGLAGELFIAGVGLAYGYIGKTELTADKFVLNPFEAGELMYRTGDLVKWTADGYVEYVGRTDRQVKLNGYRIELEEIEKQILGSGLVEAAVVVERKEDEGNQYLCGFVVSKGMNIDGIKEYLANKLPSYMIPRRFVPMGALPLTHSGKVDKERLKWLPIQKGAPEDALPILGIEKELQRIWSSVLKNEDIGVNDDFFEYGGNSINVLSMIYEMEQCGICVHVEDIFNYRTIRRISNFVQTRERVGEESKDLTEERETYNQGMVLSSIKPFNDIYYKNCFYNSLFPVLQFFHLSVLPVIVNDVICYNAPKPGEDAVIYESLTAIEDILQKMDIRVHTQQRCKTIIKKVKSGLDLKHPIIVWIDCYYSPLRPNEYHKQHRPHSLLVIGYNQKEEVFQVIENTSRDAFNYNYRTIGFHDLEKAYNSFIKNFREYKTNSYYEFWRAAAKPRMNENSSLRSIREVFHENYLCSKQKLAFAMKNIYEIKAQIAELSQSEDAFFTNQENIIELLNTVLNAKKIEEYRASHIFCEQQTYLFLRKAVTEQWNYIRTTLIRCSLMKRYNRTCIDLCLKKLDYIYELEMMVNEYLKDAFYEEEAAEMFHRNKK